MTRATLALVLCLAACGSEPEAAGAAQTAASDPGAAPLASPVDDVVIAAPAASDTVFVLENDPNGLELTGIGEPSGEGTFGVPADGLVRGLVTFETPATAGESSVYYYTTDAGGARDSARLVVRVE